MERQNAVTILLTLQFAQIPLGWNLQQRSGGGPFELENDAILRWPRNEDKCVINGRLEGNDHIDTD